MTLSTCPSCGCDLEALTTFERGPLSVFNGAIIKWRGRHIRFGPSERLIVLALAISDGAPVKRDILAEVIGYEGERPNNIVDVHVTRIKKRFRAVDPAFAGIETVRGFGIRWAA